MKMGCYDDSIAQYQKALEKALAHFAKADPESAYDLFYTAVAQERKGDKAEAARLYSKVATWNQNDLGYAMVRARARAKKS